MELSPAYAFVRRHWRPLDGIRASPRYAGMPWDGSSGYSWRILLAADGGRGGSDELPVVCC